MMWQKCLLTDLIYENLNLRYTKISINSKFQVKKEFESKIQNVERWNEF